MEFSPQSRPQSGITRTLKPATLAVLLSPVLGGPTAAAPYEVAILQGMDKVMARVSTIEAPVGEVVKFGTLEIIARHCDKRPPEETPESASFLDILSLIHI